MGWGGVDMRNGVGCGLEGWGGGIVLIKQEKDKRELKVSERRSF